MDITVERVDGLAAVEEISRVLVAAWPPPTLHYTVDFLKWQFTFPGPVARGALARINGEPVAYVGFAARRLRRGREVTPSYATAFLGVVPSARGGGTANLVYDPMIGMVAESGIPCVGFVDVQTPAARKLQVKHTETRGMDRKSLTLCRNWGFMVRPNTSPPLAVREAVSVAEVLDVMNACNDENVLWCAPDADAIEHYQRDPRGRKFIVTEENGRASAVAMVFLSEIKGPQGIEFLTTVDTVWMPEPSDARLKSLCFGASAAFAEKATSKMVGAPNLSTIDESIIKLAGLRPAVAVYEPFVYQQSRTIYTTVTSTNQEMV
ncbi:MAG: GNAT family N-acetyltransferase [Polyangiaceae bacterium]|nr:GNAT family N-acetyltransferase [Polyangiaceae bacterium]